MDGIKDVDKGCLSSFSLGYKCLFEDKRLYEGFKACIWGIVSSGSCKVSRIASSNPITGCVRHGERRLRRLLHGSNGGVDVKAERVCEVFSEEGAKRLKGEHEVLLIVDESDLRKPFGRSFEYLDKVRDLDGNVVSGFHTLNVMGIGLKGERALLYHKSFSSLAPGFKSMNVEYKLAMKQVRKALREQGVGRLLWVMDRGFDDAKLMKHIHKSGDCFVLRSKHANRKVKTEISGRIKKLQNCLDESNYIGEIELEQRLFKESQMKKYCAMNLKAIAVHVDAVGSSKVTVVEVSHEELQASWLLLSNLELRGEAEEQLSLARRVVQVYRQRWSIEDVFAWTKASLDWESVRLLEYEALRTLVMFAWVAASFLFALGGSLEQSEIQLLASFGGWVQSKKAPGKSTFSQGLAVLSHYLLIEQLKRNPAKAKELDALSSRLFGP